MNTIALIPARGDSKRIPRKNLIDFCGHPLVSWSIRQALESSVDRVYVSTDDEEIADVSRDYGADVIERPSELASDTSTLEEVINHFLTKIEPDRLVILQATSPLRTSHDIDSLVKKLDFCLGVVSGNVEPDLFLWENQKEVTFNRNPRRLRKSDFIRENGSMYGFHVRQYQGLRYIDDFDFYWMHKWKSFEIDEPEDIDICEFFMRKYILKGGD